MRLDLAELEAGLASGSGADRELALALYRGPFMPGSDAGWAGLARRRAEDAALALALDLGRRLEAEDPDAAIAAYRRATAIDPLCEAAWRGGIRLAERAGRTQEALFLRSGLRRAFLEELGVEPPPEALDALQLSAG